MDRTATRSTIEAILDDWVARDPTPPTVRQNAHLFVVAEPSSAFPRCWTRRYARGGSAGSTSGSQTRWSEGRHGLLISRRHSRRSSLWTGTRSATEPSRPTEPSPTAYEWGLIELRLTLDGGVRIFAARASDTSSRGKTAVEGVIVGLAYRAAQAAAVISQECDFRGD